MSLAMLRWSVRQAFAKQEYQRAAKLAAEFCASAPDDPEIWFIYGAACHQSGELSTALDAFEHVIRLQPENLQAHQARAAVYIDRGEVAEAITLYQHLCLRRPEDPQLHTNLAVALELAGLDEEALTYYSAALVSEPNYLNALKNRGALLTRLRRLESAMANNAEMVARFPMERDAHFNSAQTFLAASRFADAIVASQAALEIDPGFAQSWIDMGLASAALGNIEDADQMFARAEALDPEAVKVFYDVIRKLAPFQYEEKMDARTIYIAKGFDRLAEGDWSDFQRLRSRFEQWLDAPGDNPLCNMCLPFHALLLGLALPHLQVIARNAMVRFERQDVPLHALRTSVPRKLRIGYIASSFKRHPTAYCMQRIPAAHDRNHFEVFGYALNPSDNSEERQCIEAGCDSFRELVGLSDAAAAACIAADKIDVLMDIGGFTTDARPGIFSYRPAPVQIGWLDYVATRGTSFIDYMLFDPVAAPADMDSWFDEKLIRMPHSAWVCNHIEAMRPPALPDITEERTAVGLPVEGIVIVAMHTPYKVDARAFGLWMDVLRQAPSARLLMYSNGVIHEERLRNVAQQSGVDPQRLIFATKTDWRTYIRRLQAADFYVDAPLYNAMTTAIDALWAGLPLITLPGDIVSQRGGASIVTAAGLPELVAVDDADYVRIAVELCNNPGKCLELRKRLARNRDQGAAPLFDLQGFVRHLENIYRLTVKRAATGKPPEALYLAP